MKKIILLGVSGSIGSSALDIIRKNPENLRLIGVSVHSQWKQLKEILQEFPDIQIAISGSIKEEEKRTIKTYGAKNIFYGREGLMSLCKDNDADMILNGISGNAGIFSSYAAINAGKDLALANKESLIQTGKQLQILAKEKNVNILPVDSEHAAIHLCLQNKKPSEIQGIYLTASGGPFLKKPLNEFKNIQPKEALNHPIWNMGDKITIDSATLFNKGLEVIEAHYLFGIKAEKIHVLIHPQSLTHGIVQLKDGQWLASMGPPDMKLPIQYALCWPNGGNFSMTIDSSKPWEMHFEAPDLTRFPALKLAYQVLEKKGNAPAIYSLANEWSVHAFLQKKILFPEIYQTTQKAIEILSDGEEPKPEDLKGLKAEIERECERITKKKQWD